MPLYKVVLYYYDGPGELMTINYEAIRFGVKSINNVATVVGLSDRQCYAVKTFLPNQYGDGINGHAWQIVGNVFSPFRTKNIR